MVIQLYSNTSDNRKLNKDITNYGNVNVNLKEDCKLTKPTFILKADDWGNMPQNGVNYVYVPNYKRYYFIDEVYYMSGKRVELVCSVDVLMSFRNEINNLYCRILRQQNQTNPMLDDTKRLLNVNKGIVYHKANSTPFSNTNDNSICVALTVMNGGTQTATTETDEVAYTQPTDNGEESGE